MIKHNVTPLLYCKKTGFTLMEVLVSLTIIGMIAAIAPALSPKGARDEKAYETTMEIMENLKQAIVGVVPTHLAGERRYTGYVADMGELPELIGACLQPAGLWCDSLSQVDSLVSDLPLWAYTGDDTRLWTGWHGPYIDVPSGGVLKDGWGNRIIFERFNIDEDEKETVDSQGTNLRFKSLGSDGKEQEETQEASGYKADIVYVIREQDYMGGIAGYGDSEVEGITLYYPARGVLVSTPVALEDDGYFVRHTENAIPMGIRSLGMTSSNKHAEPIIFSVEPAGNFLGTVRTGQ